ncbi:MAG: circadian clock protein KaiC [Casimicrobiaceae bacterium]
MNLSTPTAAASQTKAPTGILGFDAITAGGLPRGRTALLGGGAGSGKTIFALQFLINGIRNWDEPGIFIAFEESANRIKANFQSFGWILDAGQAENLFFLEAQPTPELIQSGDFDLGGLLAILQARTKAMGARRIVLDGLDVALASLPDPVTKRREVYRLHEWLVANQLTAVITAKAAHDDAYSNLQPFGFMQFMVDCSVILSHCVTRGVSQRNLRVQKYRGSASDENESPFVIGSTGFDVAISRTLGRVDANVTDERVTSGIERLDTMLGGGYYRGATILITGFPGTAKTTLSGAFAQGSCARGERTLFVSFESDGAEVVRNLGSVNIKLRHYIDSGLLRMSSARTITGSAEIYLVRIKAMAKEHGARCLVIDPVSALAKSGNEATAHNVAERLIDWSKANGITMVCTSLLDEMSTDTDGTSPLHISTLADTWLHLNYLVQAGERNRGMSIIKSRGTAHSNQVRELILSDAGITLADIYRAGGEVLMGTMRWEKESAERAAAEVTEVGGQLKRVRLDAEEAELEVRIKSLQTALVAKQVEKALLTRTTESLEGELVRGRARIGELRGADVASPGIK